MAKRASMEQYIWDHSTGRRSHDAKGRRVVRAYGHNLTLTTLAYHEIERFYGNLKSRSKN